LQLQGDVRSHIDNLDGLVADRTQKLEVLVDEVKRLSLTDALTGCFNRRALDERLPSELERSLRYGRPLSLVFVDIDHFKAINDQHGHGVGDIVLRKWRCACRRICAARWTGWRATGARSFCW
jgi:PleD family two-component response regulator